MFYKFFELSGSIQGLARVFYENLGPNANTFNINQVYIEAM
jgi:type 1 glutamine amidotransferase